MFGNSRPLFGGTNTSSSTFGSTGNVFGGTAQQQQQQQPSGFGNTNQAGFGTMGSNANSSLFGNAGAQQTGSIFSRNVNTAQNTSFGAAGTNSGNAFGMGSGNSNLFGANSGNANANTASPFGMNRPTSGGLFGTANTGNTGASIFGQQQNRPTGIFGATNSNPAGNAFQSNVNQQPSGGGLFGQQPAGSLFGNRTNTGTAFGSGGTQGFSGFNTSTNANNNNNNTGLFGRQNNSTLGSGGGLFGQSQPQQQNTSSLFGNKPASTGTGLFGQQQQQTTSGSLFGQNQGQAQNTGTGFFGSNNTVGGVGFAGQNNTNANNNTLQPAGSVFGQKNPMQQNQLGLFGQNSNQQTQSNSLFGNKPAGSGGLFGNTNTGNTGFFNNNQQQQQQQGGGLFGQKQSSGLFGTTNTGGSLNFNTGFGNNMAQNNQSTGGLFGQKPAFGSGATGGSLFGNTGTAGNTNSTFGGTSGGLFGNNPNSTTTSTSGGMFGSQPSGTTSSLFGNTQGTTSSGLFGSKPSGGTTFGSTQTGGLFGNSNAQGSGATGSLFGNKTLNGPTGTSTTMPTTGGLFGNTANKPSTGTTGFSFGATNSATANKPFGSGLTSGTTSTTTGSGSGGLFGNKLGQSTGGLFGSNKNQTSLGLTNNTFAQNNAATPATNNVLGSIMTSLQNKPAENLFTKVQMSEAITKPEASLKVYTDSSRKLPRGLSGTLKPTSRILLSKTDSALSTTGSPFSISEGVVGKHWRDGKRGSLLGPSNLLLTERTDSVPVKLLFNPDRASFKTLVIRKQSRQKPDASLRTESHTPQFNEISFSKDSEATVQRADSKENKATPQRTLALSDVTNKALRNSFTENEKVELIKIPKVLSEDVSFLPNGYYTSPAMDTLESKSLLELRKVSNLVVGHKDYGKIEFLDPVDLSNISLKLLCGTIIVFEPRACLVYPTATTRPKKGEGINVRARITIYNCFPLNKATGEPIKDPNHPMIKRHIAMLKKDIDGNKHFESYDPVTGTYVFVVGGPVIA